MHTPLCVGIDWADDHHDVCFVSSDLSSEADGTDLDGALCRFRIPHTVEGLTRLHTRIQEYQPDPRQVLVALETPHGILVHALLQQGYQVYAINPKAVNRYKDRHSAASAKDDPRDALALAHLLRTDRRRFHPLRLLPEEYRLLEALCLDLRQLISEQTRLINRLSACLKAYYPQALWLFEDLSTGMAAAFLRAFPDPLALSNASQKRFTRLFEKQGYTRPQRVPELYRLSRQPAPAADPVAVQAGRLRMTALLDQLTTLRNHLGDYERQIRKLFQSLPDNQNLPSLPGIGERLAPELAAMLGPRPEPPPAREEEGADPPLRKMVAAQKRSWTTLAGCAPVTKQSGKFRCVLYRRACDKALRRTFRDWAQASLQSSLWARAFYAQARQRGQPHETALRNLAIKLTAILLRLWATGEEYDEQRHIQNLKRRNVAWAANL